MLLGNRKREWLAAEQMHCKSAMTSLDQWWGTTPRDEGRGIFITASEGTAEFGVFFFCKWVFNCFLSY